MFKRTILTLTFVATLATAVLTFAPPAQAWRYYGGGPYAYPTRYYDGPRTSFYAPYRSYRSYDGYPGPVVVEPRVYQPYYYNSYYAPGVYYSSPGVSVSVGL
jgi:hypothetical protein